MSHQHEGAATRRTAAAAAAAGQHPPTGGGYWHSYGRSHHGSSADYHAARGPLRLRAVHRASLSGRLPSGFQPYGHPGKGNDDDDGAPSLGVGDGGGTGGSRDTEDATAGGSTFLSDPTRAQQQQQQQGKKYPGASPPNDVPYVSMHSLHRMESQTSAASIFLYDVGSSEDPTPKLGDRRAGPVDGHEIEFELCQAVNSKPKTSRLDRTSRSTREVNVTRSPLLFRCRLYLLQFGFVGMSLLYLAAFVVLNVVFAGLYHIPDGKCCDDSDMTFSQVFDFSVQTSATIGYGGYVPRGLWANFLVVIQSCLALMLGAIYTGLLFSKFQTPHAKLDFSDVMTMSNFHGMPCLELRVGNADGESNPLIDAVARLDCTYMMESTDEGGEVRLYTQSERLHFMMERRAAMTAVWTLRHCLDEHSPLLGMRLDEWPGSAIREFRVSVQATQDITKGTVSVQSVYQPEDILVGYRFRDQIRYDEATQTLVNDYAMMSEIEPQPVWYPVRKSAFRLP
jgi:inward rectifier potassium channel